MTLSITYYHKAEEKGLRLATFGIHIKEWALNINNFAILKRETTPWFIAPPAFKNKKTDTWENTIFFDSDMHKRFMDSVRRVLEEYLEKNQIVFADPVVEEEFPY